MNRSIFIITTIRARLVRPSHPERVHVTRDERRRGREIHSGPEHAGATAGRQFWRKRASIPFLRWSWVAPLRRRISPRGRHLQPSVGVVRDSIQVIDRVLKHDLPQGPGWHRYNHDGYGEKDHVADNDTFS